MQIELPLSFLTFAIAATVTPGPNNVMVMASGANFGLGRTTPHLLGISGGVLIIILLVGLGLMALLDAAPILKSALSVISVAYLLWLAWKIANARPAAAGQPKAKPLTFIQAALYQWVNPKIWVTGLSAVTLFAPDRALSSVAGLAIILALIGLAANALWAWMGTILRHQLKSDRRLRLFNIAMALLLVASLYPTLR